jgi:hypothetical protein
MGVQGGGMSNNVGLQILIIFYERIPPLIGTAGGDKSYKIQYNFNFIIWNKELETQLIICRAMGLILTH